MTIMITVGAQRFRATLADSAAARDLLAQLPLSIPMTDHGGVEKTGRLPSSLSLDGHRRADTGQRGGPDPDAVDPSTWDLHVPEA